MKKIIILYIISLGFYGCCRNNYPPIARNIKNDSTNVRIVRELVEKWRIDTVIIEIPAQSDKYEGDKKVSFLETDYAESNAIINPDGTLFHDLRNKPQKIPVGVPVKDTEITEKKDSIVYREIYIEIPVDGDIIYKMKWYEEIFFYIGLVIVLISCIYGAVRVIKRKFFGGSNR